MQCFRNSTLYILFVRHHIFSAVSFNVFALVQALIFFFLFFLVFFLFCCVCVLGVFWLFFLEGGRWEFFFGLGDFWSTSTTFWVPHFFWLSALTCPKHRSDAAHSWWVVALCMSSSTHSTDKGKETASY